MEVRGIAIIVGLALGLPAARPATAFLLTRYPSLWIQTPTSITIAWKTDLASTGKVRYWISLSIVKEAAHAGTTTDHAVTLTGLAPASQYRYRVVSGTDTLTNGDDTFRTAPVTYEPFRMLAFGDLGRATPAQIEVAARIDSLNADLAILTGDIIYEGGEAENFQPQYFDIYRPTIARIPFYPSLGNHDVGTANGQPYLDAFYLPTANSGNERYYSFDHSNAHIVALEVTRENVSPNTTMRNWLAADLAATTKHWKLVFFHVAMYSNLGEHGGDSTIAAALGPIFDAAGVDIVFQGHNHYYTRTYPILGGATVSTVQEPNYVNPGAPIYIVTGGAGRSLDALAPLTSMEAISRRTFHTTYVDVAGITLTLGAVERDGTQFDTMTLTKDTPAAVMLVDFLAASEPEGVRLRWRVPIESDATGFHVYRGATPADVSTRLTASPLLEEQDYSYLDGTAEPGREYYYSLGVLRRGGREERIGLVSGSRGGPYRFAVLHTRPNPSDGVAEIAYTLDRASDVRISLFDVAGRLVRVLERPGLLGPGPQAARWDGRDRSGRALPAGLYFARIQSEDRSIWTRILRVH